MKLYKLTNENMQTFNGCQWKLGETKETSGKGELCGPGFLHAYTDPILAVFLNPIHADFKNPRLFEAKGNVRKTDRGLKVGCTKLTLKKELPLPTVTTKQCVRFAILCAKEVYKDPTWNKWADAWLDKTDRTKEAVLYAIRAVYAAKYNADLMAAYAVEHRADTIVAAVNATEAAYEAIVNAKNIKWRVACAAAWAAGEAEIDLLAIARKAIEE